MPKAAILKRFPLRFEKRQLELEWSKFTSVASRRYDINVAFCFIYLVAVFLNWGTTPTVNFGGKLLHLVTRQDYLILAAVSTVSTELPWFFGWAVALMLVVTKTLPRAKKYHFYFDTAILLGVLATVTLNVDGHTPQFQGLTITAVQTALLYGLTAGFQIRSAAEHYSAVVIFIISSGIVWGVLYPQFFLGMGGFRALLLVIKVVLTGLVAAYAQDLVLREAFLVARRIQQHQELPRANRSINSELAFYFSEINFETGKYIFPIEKHIKVVTMTRLEKLKRFWRQWIYIRFVDNELEQAYLGDYRAYSIHLHVLTLMMNVGGACLTFLFEGNDPYGLAQAGVVSTSTLRLIFGIKMAYFPVMLLIPTLALISKRIRGSPAACQKVILIASIGNIVGWLAAYLSLGSLKVTDPLAFHRALAGFTAAIFSAGVQSGLLSYLLLPLLVVVMLAHLALIFLFKMPFKQYSLTALLEVCLTAAGVCLVNEFEFRKLFLLRKWAEDFVDVEKIKFVSKTIELPKSLSRANVTLHGTLRTTDYMPEEDGQKAPETPAQGMEA
ncbi:uncharacterized protein BJ171DRAFT_567170 [Polychytrium aggregatum]|uniref:uncharacterized protein n=1 Tax=Polychytrium aggregatum TaxID=110093 RepID=UPI0022FED633|nr:uncharacterized protein BJ171DRAFT_567170 [Polychytrium aggregatum]KAI9205865.1 hypothetical protein BJ171DRAFT_567170 [Polychytrium aggregatum]